MENISVDKLCQAYVKIRTQKNEVKKELEEKIEAYDAMLSRVGDAIKEKLVAAGAKNIKTEHGTAYLQVKTRYYAMDKEAFNTWVLTNHALDLYEARIHQSNMAKWLEENPTNPPPGIQADPEITVTVRKT
jgi:hypothetical protein